VVEKISKYRFQIIKSLILVGISLLYLIRIFNEFKQPYIEGDGIEYVLMTEAFRNHGSPDIKLSDIIKFKKRCNKYDSWEKFNQRADIDKIIQWQTESKRAFLETGYGLYISKNGKLYCQHFFVYSLINLPSYFIFKKLGPIKCFHITNALLVIIACWSLLFLTPFTLINQILASLIFCFSSCYWYLGWEHTEVFTSSLVAISLVRFLNKKYYSALVLLSIVCMQTQPLTLLFGFLALITLIKKGINLKSVVILGTLGIITIIPSLFYYYNFDTTNLIKDAGFLDTKYITVNRVKGFYTDLSQGVILTIPLILIFYLPLIFVELRKMIRKRITWDYTIFIPFVVLIISITVSTMGNWNHGMAIINRYATWISIIIMIHCFYLLQNNKREVTIIIFSAFFISQLFTTLYHQQFNKLDWSSAQYTPIAKWLLQNHADFYNPDPTIFAGRTQPAVALAEENSPIIYFYDHKITKILVNRNRIDELSNLGLSKESIDEIKKQTNYNYDWGYINMNNFKSSLTGDEIYKKLRKRKLEAIFNKIVNSPEWMKQIETKAKDWGVTIEEACWKDAEYSLKLEEEKQENK
jgi:hypothetical protein